MSLILDVIMGLLRLSAACRRSSAALRVVPPHDLLEVTFGSLVACQTSIQAAAFFDLDGPCDEQVMVLALEQLIQAGEHALQHDPSAREHLERARSAIQELLTISSLVQSVDLSDLHVQFSNALVFRYLHYCYVGSPSAQPVTALVGAVPQGESLLALPLGGSPALQQLQLAYAVTDPYPRVRTDYWLRYPPNPNKQRVSGWSALDVGAQRNIELYRQRIPGEKPVLSLASEAISCPITITGPGVKISIDTDAATVTGVRTTVRDKFQSWLLVAVRVFAPAPG